MLNLARRAVDPRWQSLDREQRIENRPSTLSAGSRIVRHDPYFNFFSSSFTVNKLVPSEKTQFYNHSRPILH